MYNPSIARWLSPDPAADKYPDWSPYNYVLGNPILNIDPRGDTVKVSGFEQEEVVDFLRGGLLVNKKKNPYEFDGDGNLQINQDKYNSLSDAQKEVVDNIGETINSDITFTITKGTDATIIAKDADGRDVKLGEFGGMVTIGNKSDSKQVTIWMTGDSYGSTVANKDTNPRDSNGFYLDVSPKIGIYHELGGHGYYRYIANDPNQSGKSIDYENKVRALNSYNTKQRAYDKAHPKPEK